MYALQGSNDYVEAEKAFDAYLTIIDNGKKTLATVQPQNVGMNNEDSMLPDLEPDEIILQTMAEGICLLVKHRNKGRRALDIAIKLEQNIKSWDIKKPEVLAAAWYAVGLANSLWSMQSGHHSDSG